MAYTEPGTPSPAPAYAPPPPRRRSLWWLWVLLGLFGLMIIGFFMLLMLSPLIFLAIASSEDSGGSGPGVAVIRVNGVIVSSDEGGFLGGGVASSESIVKQIERALEDRRAKAILVRIDSPGGSAAASEEIYHELIKARRKKPVIASMGDVAASGGYYVASAADEIYCNAGTVTGSIGVITSHLDLSNLMKKLGANYETFTSGEFKDMGSPARPTTAREKALLKAMIGDIYDQFVTAVSDGRKLPKAEVKKIADGRILTGRQALKAKLVDEIGGYQAALKRAGEKGGITGKVNKIEYGPRGLFGALFGADDMSMSLNALTRELLLRQTARELSGVALH